FDVMLPVEPPQRPVKCRGTTGYARWIDIDFIVRLLAVSAALRVPDVSQSMALLPTHAQHGNRPMRGEAWVHLSLKTHVAASRAWRYVGTTTVSTSPRDRRQPCHFTQPSICIPATACWPSWMATANRCCGVDAPTSCHACSPIWLRTGTRWSAWRWSPPTTGTGWSMA